MASQIAAITGEELSLSVLSFSDKLVPWSPLGWEGVAQLYLVLVCPVFGGGRGSFPSAVSPCRLWLTGGTCPLQELTSGKCNDQTHARCALTKCPQLGTAPRQLQRVFLCVQPVEPSERPLHYNASLAFLPFTSVTQMHVLVPHAELGCQGGSGSAQRVSCLQLADLVPREVHIGTELSFSAV